MVVDIIASLSFVYVMYKMARESSRNERFGGIIGTGIGAICCASQLDVWPNGCTAPFTGALSPCGPLGHGHPRLIITLAIIMTSTWLGGTIAGIIKSRSN